MQRKNETSSIGNTKRADPKEAKNSIIGQSYSNLKSLVERYSKSNERVLFIGETGTGKERFMELYMALSELPGKKMIVNCAATPDELFYSEVFGHVKGAFTGANDNRKGKIASCKDGILALDEIGDAPPKFQALVLRVLEGRGYSPLGSDAEEETDALIIAATNRPENLRQEIIRRFQVILPVPPLQRSDIPGLVNHFMKGKHLKQDKLDEILARDWPGNIGELENYCKRLKVEEGEKVFSSTPSEKMDVFSPFDYERYRGEVEIWNNHIQPILHKHNICQIKYEYQPWDDNWVDDKSKDKDPEKRFWAMLLAHQIWDSPNLAERDDKRYTHGSVKLFKWLQKGIHKELTIDYHIPDGDTDITDEKITPEELLPKFVHHLRKHIETRTLPYLLKLIAKPNQSTKTPTKPALSHLLDLSETEAVKEFKKIFLSYQLATGRDTGLSKKDMKQKIKRLGMKE